MKRGFTLIELIVVVSILAVLLAVVSVRIVTLQKNEVDLLLSDLRYARTTAVSTQETVKVTFDIENDAYSISRQDHILVQRTLEDIDIIRLNYIDNPLVIYATGAFSKSGNMEIQYLGKPSKITFTVGVARFNEVEP